MVTSGNCYERHKGVTKKDGRPEGYTICATKTIKAPVDKVYKIWTKVKKNLQLI